MRKPVEKPPLVRHKRRWECNIKADLKRIRWKGVKSINLAQNRHKRREIFIYTSIMRYRVSCLFVFVALQPIVVVLSQPSSGL